MWGTIDRRIDGAFRAVQDAYGRSLTVALRWRKTMLLVTLAVFLAGTIGLYKVVPKGFMPIQDTGLLQGFTLASPDISFDAMAERQKRVVKVLLDDPAVADVASTIGITSGWSSVNRGQLGIDLKPLAKSARSAARRSSPGCGRS